MKDVLSEDSAEGWKTYWLNVLLPKIDAIAVVIPLSYYRNELSHIVD